MDSNNLKQVLDKYGKYVVQQAKSNLTKDKDAYGGNKGGGPLYNSIEYKLDTEPSYFLIDFLMEDYGPFVFRTLGSKPIPVANCEARILSPSLFMKSNPVGYSSRPKRMGTMAPSANLPWISPRPLASYNRSIALSGVSFAIEGPVTSPPRSLSINAMMGP